MKQLQKHLLTALATVCWISCLMEPLHINKNILTIVTIVTIVWVKFKIGPMSLLILIYFFTMLLFFFFYCVFKVKVDL